MRVLIINTSERAGGAAVAASRLMESLKINGIKAKMMVRDKQTDQISVVRLKSNWLQVWKFVWERVVIWSANRFRRHHLFDVDIANTGTDITSLPEFRQADVIHLHWINQGMLSLKDIRKILASGKPVVWTMHDMWPCTGICHYARECTSYQQECHHCSYIYKGGSGKDLSYRTFKKKRELYSNNPIHFVTCSRWLKEQAQKSALLAGHSVINIPNAINTNLFKPLNRKEARGKCLLPQDKKLILFGSVKITDKRKGADYLIEACKLLAEKHPELKDTLGLVVFGNQSQQLQEQVPFRVYPLPYIKNEHELVDIYNAVDLFAIPSLEENLPNMIMEAMACGVPCVGFNVGGIPEMIDHLHNGYVAQYKSSEDFANGIHWILSEPEYKELSEQAHRKVLGNYSERIIAKKYTDVYNKVTGKMHNVHPTPKFSIITVTYNAEKVLEDTIQSVIAQTYHHVEYIIVDGDSKDGTLAIIDRYRSRIHTVVSEPDNGLYDAMNKGIALASGEYLCFLNAGDCFHEDDTLQQMVHTINGTELPDVIYGETAIVDHQRHFLRMRRLSAPEKLTWRSFKQGMLVCHQAFFARHTLVEPYDLKYHFSADFDWCIRIMKKADNLHNTHLTLIDYLDEGMTTQNRKASLKERFRIMAKHYGLISTTARHAWFLLRTVIKR